MSTKKAIIKVLHMHGIDYCPADAAIIQVDIKTDRIELTKPVAWDVVGNTNMVAGKILEQLSATAGDASYNDRLAVIEKTKTTRLPQAGWIGEWVAYRTQCPATPVA